MENGDGARLAQAASAFLGTPFRLRGRDADTGLDCVGLVETALARLGRPVSVGDYSLKMRSIARFDGLALRIGLEPASGANRAGDILLLKVGPYQFHLGIVGMDGALIHAHAGLRRVVRSPLPQGDIVERWRLPAGD